MKEKKRVLFVTHEMNPYVAISEISKIARELPQYIQDNDMEIRILMPKFGTINERRYRLHEVVRLSGINIIIDEDDYPLIIKVASLPGARMQVYFLDNEDFFKRKAIFGNEKESFFGDNSERMVFFCKGVIETVKKFGWPPDIVHCHGWMSSLIPFYLKTSYKDEPVFKNTKVIYSVYNNTFKESLPDSFLSKASLSQYNVDENGRVYYEEKNNIGLDKGAISFSDGIIIGSKDLKGELVNFIDTIKKPVLEFKDEDDYLDQYHQFYQDMLATN